MKKITGLGTGYQFGGDRWEVWTLHHCSTCGLSDEEWQEIDHYNDGVLSCLPVMEEMEKRLLELEEFFAQGQILPN